MKPDIMVMKQIVCTTFSRLFLFLLSLTVAQAADSIWPQFRGVNGSGIANNQKPPVQFGKDRNLKWSTPLGSGASSPSVWNDHIFLTVFNQAENKLETVCIHAKTGQMLWSQSAPFETLEAFHPRESSPASATPATDGQRVVTYFGSFGLICHDFQGNKLWELALPVPSQVGDFGSGCSPIIHNGLVYLNRDQQVGSELLAVHLDSGQVAWRTDRSDFSSSWTTPIIWQENGNPTLVLAGSIGMRGYDPNSGALKWGFDGLPAAACTTPVVHGDRLFFAGWSPGQTDSPMPPFQVILDQNDANKDGVFELEEAQGQFKSFFVSFDQNRDNKVTQEEWQVLLDNMAKGRNSAFALKAGGNGTLDDSHIAWRQDRGLPYVPSPLLYQDRLWLVKDGGLLTSYHAASGEPVLDRERLGALGNYYASPVAANGYIYAASIPGIVSVFKAEDTFHLIASTDLDERITATPAIANDTLYVRSENRLWAFSNE